MPSIVIINFPRYSHQYIYLCVSASFRNAALMVYAQHEVKKNVYFVRMPGGAK